MNINEDLYVGGGYICYIPGFIRKHTNRPSSNIYRLALGSSKWETIPSCPSNMVHFTLVTFRKKLHLIGGEFVTKQDIPPKYDKGLYSNLVMTYDTVTGKWASDLPPLNHPRRLPSATATETHLIVAGGVDEKGNAVNSIEVLDLTVENSLWQVSGSLPEILRYPQIVAINESVYIGADRADGIEFESPKSVPDWKVNSKMNHVFEVPVSVITSKFSDVIPYQKRKFLPPVPSSGCALINAYGKLLAVCGRHSSGVFRESQFYLFNKKLSQWDTIIVPYIRRLTPAAVFTKDTLFVVGGYRPLWRHFLFLLFYLTILAFGLTLDFIKTCKKQVLYCPCFKEWLFSTASPSFVFSVLIIFWMFRLVMKYIPHVRVSESCSALTLN